MSRTLRSTDAADCKCFAGPLPTKRSLQGVGGRVHALITWTRHKPYGVQASDDSNGHAGGQGSTASLLREHL